MPQSTVQICIEEQRERTYKALNVKIVEFKKFISDHPRKDGVSDKQVLEVERYLREAISFKNLFEFKTTVITLTRDDIDLLTRILNTSA